MLAVFGMPGLFELVLIGLLCMIFIGVPIVILAVVFWVTRRNHRNGGS